MTRIITLALRVEDAEPILHDAAEQAARYSAWCDYITKRTFASPVKTSFEKDQKEWHAKFLHFKRIVEAFGVEYEPTSEQDTITVMYPQMIGGKRRTVDLGLGKGSYLEGGRPDYSKPQPDYRITVHNKACLEAARRVVNRWRATLPGKAGPPLVC